MSQESSSQNQSKAIVEKLKKYGRRLLHSSPNFVGTSDDVTLLVTTDPFACLVGCAFNSRQKSWRAWDIPFQIKKKGMLDAQKLASMSHQELVHLMNSLPRLPIAGADKGARTLKDVSRLVVSLGGDLIASWKDATVFDVKLDLEIRIYGVGEVVADFTVRMLHDNFGLFESQKRRVNIKADLHLQRVFTRTGLIPFEDVDLAIIAARHLNPDYPGELDRPAFNIGKRWCHKTLPNCPACPLADVCPKLID